MKAKWKQRTGLSLFVLGAMTQILSCRRHVPAPPANQPEQPTSAENISDSETDRPLVTHSAPAQETVKTPSKPSAEKKEGSHVASGKEEHKYTNKLIGETSPYLLQHAHNPVNWYPWGEEAFEKARKEDKAIFLSVGYSSCHWCHVMAHESFENEEIAAILNEHFVSIKVDREERPDVDQIYMSAVQLMTGAGGWPMSVFLTPEGKPFWGGTYFPPESTRGRPGFKDILEGIAKGWREDRVNAERVAEEITKAIRAGSRADVSQFGKGLGAETEPASITRAQIVAAVGALRHGFDSVEGGFGGAPKFPPSMSLSLLLREHFRTGDGELLRIVTLTLDKMARGGMYDHLGGGFHRYSTDARWLVPHFEKMLYDNALLTSVYLDAFQVTGDPFYERVAREVLDYVIRDMTHSAGGFYSATDADSEGEEGKFFVWSKKEIASVLGANDTELFSAYYDIKDDGNFSSREEYHAGLNILNVPRAPKEVAEGVGLPVDEMERRLAAMRAKLLAVRSKRVAPGLDDKTLVAWNGLMISAFARGFQVLGDPRYREAAERSAGFILKTMMTNGRLLRTYRNDEAKLMGYLNDYAFFIAGLIDLYEATFEIKWLDSALALNDVLIKHYWDEAEGGFFFTADDHETLIARSKRLEDSAIPSGNSVAAMNLLRLAKLTDNDDLFKKAERALAASLPFVDRFPHAFCSALAAVDFFTESPKEIVIAGRPDAEDTRALLAEARRHYLPNRVFALVDPGDPDAAELGKKLPLVANKSLIGGKAACFVCKDHVCKLPVTSPDDVARALGVEAKE